MTSMAIAAAVPPAAAISSASAVSRSTRRAASATFAPLAARIRANRLPSPEDAPVTSATRPERSNDGPMGEVSSRRSAVLLRGLS